MYVMRSQPPPSRLNPNAPIFIPMASYQTVEDYSDQWWDLVHSSPYFRDYWLHDCFEDPQSDDPVFPENDDLVLPDFDAFFDLYLQQQEEKKVQEEEKNKEELITMGALKWSRSNNGRLLESPRSFEKAPKIVKSVRVNPRTIHQPR